MRACENEDSRENAQQAKLESSNAQRVDSSVDCHAVQAPLAMTGWGWIAKEAALRLLCHALPCKARNDGKEALYKQDSRDCGGVCKGF